VRNTVESGSTIKDAIVYVPSPLGVSAEVILKRVLPHRSVDAYESEISAVFKDQKTKKGTEMFNRMPSGRTTIGVKPENSNRSFYNVSFDERDDITLEETGFDSGGMERIEKMASTLNALTVLIESEQFELQVSSQYLNYPDAHRVGKISKFLSRLKK
jgi:hypothetical protein